MDILNKSAVLNLHSTTLDELVRNRYISGLRKIGEFKAWSKSMSVFNNSITQNYEPIDLVQLTGI